MGESSENDWRDRIGERLRQLRALKGWSQADLSRQTGDRLSPSRIANYEQGTRMPGPGEAVILGSVFGIAASHILCLDSDMPALTRDEVELVLNFRKLPESQRAEYAERIAEMAKIFSKPVAHERLPDKQGPAPVIRRRSSPRRAKQ